MRTIVNVFILMEHNHTVKQQLPIMCLYSHVTMMTTIETM